MTGLLVARDLETTAGVVSAVALPTHALEVGDVPVVSREVRPLVDFVGVRRAAAFTFARVAALFVDPDGVYANLPGVDCWDEKRDARLYDGPYPVVAHPPCGSWCQLASVNEARWGKKIGDDGGCFEATLRAVRAFGGVLEHPAYSLAWGRYELPRPSRGSWQRSFLDDGWVTEVSQSAYGHPARKRTWLYLVGEPVSLDWNDPEGYGVVGAGVHSGQAAGRPRIDGAEASATPTDFRDELLSMARSAYALNAGREAEDSQPREAA